MTLSSNEFSFAIKFGQWELFLIEEDEVVFWIN